MLYPNEHELASLRKRETALQDSLPLDFAASPPLLLSAIQSFHQDAASHAYANPHSRSPSSVRTSLKIDSIRARIQSDIFGLTPDRLADWDIVFTSGATAAIKLIADHFVWSPHASYRYLRDSHTSLVGLRGAALKAGAKVHVAATVSDLLSDPLCGPTLAAYPLQCNATGRRWPLELCRDIKRSNPTAYVLLDTAAYLGTSPLYLSQLPLDEAPDFVIWSAYKTYGWPTGLGCLLIKRSSAHVLQRAGYFGGGTIDNMSVNKPFSMKPPSTPDDPIHRQFEDGTLPFLDIIALESSMNVFHRFFGTLDAVSQHVLRLVGMAITRMQALCHSSGAPVCRLYGLDVPLAPHGSAIAFTLLDHHGQPVGHVELDKLAAVNDIHLRTGGLCNIGALAAHLDLTDDDLEAKGKVCWDEEEFIQSKDGRTKPTGMARVSFGALSTHQDVDRWLAFLKKFFVHQLQLEGDADTVSQENLSFEVADLCLYPIKSCSGMNVPSQQPWPITPQGLLHDREWMVVDISSKRALTQKRHPRMACIGAVVNLKHSSLTIQVPHHGTFSIDIRQAPSCATQGKVCVDTVESFRHSTSQLDAALTDWLGLPCTLHRFPSSSQASRHTHFAGTSRTPIRLSNESPFLLINSASVKSVERWCQSVAEERQVSPNAFRANFVVQAKGNRKESAFVEDGWQSIRIGTQTFQTLALCRRCQLVNVDQQTGEVLRQPLGVLSQNRRNSNGQITFGIHLMHQAAASDQVAEVRVGDRVQIIY